MKLDQLSLQLVKGHPREIVRVVEQLSDADKDNLIQSLSPALAAELLLFMQPVNAVHCLITMTPERAAGLLQHMNTQHAARLLRGFPEQAREKILAAAGIGAFTGVRLSLRYPQGVIGAIMDTDLPAIANDLTVKQALNFVKEHPALLQNIIFIVDPHHTLLGYLDIKDLITANDKAMITNLLKEAPYRLAARSDIRNAKTNSGWRHMDVLPVLDHNNVLVGILTRANIVKILTDEEGPLSIGESDELLLDLIETLWGTCYDILFQSQDKVERQDQRT